VLSGTVGAVNAAFGVDLTTFAHANGTYRGRTGPIFLPDELRGVVQAVLGLDNRPQAEPHFRLRRSVGNVREDGASAPGPASYTPDAIAKLYGFPGAGAHGQTIALIELGGGYRPADIDAYFQKLGIAAPQVATVAVDHAPNRPTGDPSGPDGEVMLDIEVVGAAAPGAKIVVYFAPNTDAGFLNAITTAIHDTANAPDIISISWGSAEGSWTQQALTAFDEAFQAAATMGITVCVATGDNGSSDGSNDGQPHADFPASSPYALACGGTSIAVADGRISRETVWNDLPSDGATGGGESGFFALPPWQSGLSIALTAGGSRPLQKRGIPDVCADADPRTGYEVLVDGTSAVVGGTSAAAPLWAALIARINAAHGTSAGLINPKLYAGAAALNDVTEGNNGAYAAAKGWDAASGLGSPIGAAVEDVLRAPAPGAPQPAAPAAVAQSVRGFSAADASSPIAPAVELGARVCHEDLVYEYTVNGWVNTGVACNGEHVVASRPAPVNA
jgi:kumamolisin